MVAFQEKESILLKKDIYLYIYNYIFFFARNKDLMNWNGLYAHTIIMHPYKENTIYMLNQNKSF